MCHLCQAAMDDALRRRNAADMQELEQDLKDRKAHDGNTWFVQLPERIEFLGRIMVHKTDWLEYRLSIHPETGRLWAGKGDMPPEYALQLCWSLACALTDPPATFAVGQVLERRDQHARRGRCSTATWAGYHEVP